MWSIGTKRNQRPVSIYFDHKTEYAKKHILATFYSDISDRDGSTLYSVILIESMGAMRKNVPIQKFSRWQYSYDKQNIFVKLY